MNSSHLLQKRGARACKDRWRVLQHKNAATPPPPPPAQCPAGDNESSNDEDEDLEDLEEEEEEAAAERIEESSEDSEDSDSGPEEQEGPRFTTRRPWTSEVISCLLHTHKFES